MANTYDQYENLTQKEYVKTHPTHIFFLKKVGSLLFLRLKKYLV